MNEPTLHGLTERLDRLEGEGRRWRRAAAALAVGIAAAVLMGQASRVPKVVEAEAFVLRDGSGNIRAELSALPQGGVGWLLFDSDGKMRVNLGTVSGGAAILALFPREGSARAWLKVEANGMAHLVLRDEHNRDRAVLGSVELQRTKTGAIEIRPPSSLVLFDKDGKVMWSAP